MSVRYDVPRDQIDAEFDKDMDDLLSESPYAWAVVQGFRTLLQQKGLYTRHLAGGPLASAPGHSAHEFGLAEDVAALLPSGKPSWDESLPQWGWLREQVDKHPRLHGGWHFADNDHVQAVKWQAKKAELQAAGKW